MQELFQELVAGDSAMLWVVIGAFITGWFVRGAIQGGTGKMPDHAPASGGKHGSFSSVEEVNIQLDHETLGEIQEFLRQGDKIRAIKVLREKTGKDLADAKRSVEVLETMFNKQR